MTDHEKPPVLMIPGFACTARMYEGIVSALPGRATIVADHTRAATMGEIADAILAEAPPRFALCGFSMGGYIALEIMARAPERVSRLALMDTQAQPESAAARAARLERLEVARARGMRAAAEHNWTSMVHPARYDNSALKQIVVDMAQETGLAAFERQAAAILARADSQPILASIKAPTLVLVGAQDALTPPARAHEMADAIAGARCVVIPESGHMTTLEQPAATQAALVEFLS